MDDLVIRPATGDDADAIAALWQQLVDHHHGLDAALPTATRDGPKRYADRVKHQLDDSFTHIIVAEQAGEIAGYVLGMVVDLLPDMFQGKMTGFLADIYVDESLRQRGVGRALVDELASWFKSRGVEQMEWYVASRNAAGRAFWENLGGRDVMVRMRLDL